MKQIPGAASLLPTAGILAWNLPGFRKRMRKDELMRKSMSSPIAWDLPEGGMRERSGGEEQRLGIVGRSPFPLVFAENSGQGDTKGAGCR